MYIQVWRCISIYTFTYISIYTTQYIYAYISLISLLTALILYVLYLQSNVHALVHVIISTTLGTVI